MVLQAAGFVIASRGRRPRCVIVVRRPSARDAIGLAVPRDDAGGDLFLVHESVGPSPRRIKTWNGFSEPVHQTSRTPPKQRDSGLETHRIIASVSFRCRPRSKF